MTNFHGQDVPYDMCCNAMAVLKIDSVNKPGKTMILEECKYTNADVEECKYTDAEKQQCNMLSDDDDGLLRCKKESQKDFL